MGVEWSLYRETVPARQLGTWLAAALCPVAIQLGATAGWRTVALSGVVCGIAVWTVWKWGRFGHWGSVGAYILLTIVTGQLLKETAMAWMGNSYPWVPLVLLGLALWSALKGASTAARVGCVLFWVVLFVYPVTFGAALRDVNWNWAVAEGGDFDGLMALLLLLPALGKTLLKDRYTPTKGIVLPAVFALIGTLLTLGFRVSSFYEMVRSIDLLGAVKHFETVICAGATLGWFLLMNYCLTLCGALGEGRASVVMGALVMAAWMLCDVHIQYNILPLFGGIFWVVIPILTQVMDERKKMKKSENTP